MTTIRAFTTIEQSSKLAEILPLESADMFLAMNGTLPVMSKYIDNGLVTADETAIPCWSLAALLEVLPEYNLQRTDWGNKTEYKIVVTVNEDNYASNNYDNPVDTCYELILKLNELKLL